MNSFQFLQFVENSITRILSNETNVPDIEEGEVTEPFKRTFRLDWPGDTGGSIQVDEFNPFRLHVVLKLFVLEQGVAVHYFLNAVTESGEQASTNWVVHGDTCRSIPLHTLRFLELHAYAVVRNQIEHAARDAGENLMAVMRETPCFLEATFSP